VFLFKFKTEIFHVWKVPGNALIRETAVKVLENETSGNLP